MRRREELRHFSKYTNSEENIKSNAGGIRPTWQLTVESFTNGAF